LSSLSSVGIIVHGWGIIVQVGTRSVSCFTQSSFVGARLLFVCGAHHSWVCHGWWLSLVGFRMLFVIRGCWGHCVNWVLGLVCGCHRLLVGCWLESRIDVAHSGATSVVWFLCEKRGGGGCYTAHLDVVSHEGGCGLSLALNVVGSVIGCGATWAPASCVKKGEGREGGYLPQCYPSSIIDTCCNSAIVVCHITIGDVAPAFCMNRGEGGQEGLRTWTNGQ